MKRPYTAKSLTPSPLLQNPVAWSFKHREQLFPTGAGGLSPKHAYRKPSASIIWNCRRGTQVTPHLSFQVHLAKATAIASVLSA